MPAGEKMNRQQALVYGGRRGTFKGERLLFTLPFEIKFNQNIIK